MTGQFSFSNDDISNLLAEWCKCGTIHLTLGGLCLNFKPDDFRQLSEKLSRAVAHFEEVSRQACAKQAFSSENHKPILSNVFDLFQGKPLHEIRDQ